MHCIYIFGITLAERQYMFHNSTFTTLAQGTPSIGGTTTHFCWTGRGGPCSAYGDERPATLSTSPPRLCHRWFVLRYGTTAQYYTAGFTILKDNQAPSQVRIWWQRWHFYMQSCGHMVNSQQTCVCECPDINSRVCYKGSLDFGRVQGTWLDDHARGGTYNIEGNGSMGTPDKGA